MKKLFLIPPLLLFISILLAHISGNDKATFLILSVIFINICIFIITGLIIIFKKENSPSIKSLFLGGLFTLLYIIISILVSRSGLIDLSILLGFR